MDEHSNTTCRSIRSSNCSSSSSSSSSANFLAWHPAGLRVARSGFKERSGTWLSKYLGCSPKHISSKKAEPRPATESFIQMILPGGLTKRKDVEILPIDEMRRALSPHGRTKSWLDEVFIGHHSHKAKMSLVPPGGSSPANEFKDQECDSVHYLSPQPTKPLCKLSPKPLRLRTKSLARHGAMQRRISTTA